MGKVLKYQVKMIKDLEKLRKKVDKTDKKIQKYLKKREKFIQIIGQIKKKNKIKIEDKTREKEILEKIESPYIKKIFLSIIKISKERE